MTTIDTDDIDDARYELLCDAIADLCAGHPASMVRCALGAMLAESFARVPIAHRDTELRYDLRIIRQFVRELPP